MVLIYANYKRWVTSMTARAVLSSGSCDLPQVYSLATKVKDDGRHVTWLVNRCHYVSPATPKGSGPDLENKLILLSTCALTVVFDKGRVNQCQVRGKAPCVSKPNQIKYGFLLAEKRRYGL